ncbi:DUF2937 family protein [Methylobacterium sp. E-045]|uniref:DUF2937 family protein n=1 Tax=Methylobacterium sp. E-045 TaxID=2836575 RepID=UPI001FBBC365|nr:DUF2937 family protein [Methylobacterium sp. E-045]MCJ2130000.1 DUF2937 family protein [Methylobacterium sp. E-045]
MLRVIRTLGLALGLLGGIVAAQGPEFAQQYTQRLGGTLDELRRSIAALDADAAASGTNRQGAVDRLRGNGDALVARRGEAARADIERLQRLDAQKQALAEAGGPMGRFAALLRDPDMALARATYQDYVPAVPASADGIIAGFLGFLATWAGWRVLTDVGRRLVPGRRQPKTA